MYQYISSFQQAVIRNLNDKQAQLQKQLDNVIREGDAPPALDYLHSQLPANGEINLLSNKVAGIVNCPTHRIAKASIVSELERDMELERRKVHELQDSSREREKEYQKLKVASTTAWRFDILTVVLGSIRQSQAEVVTCSERSPAWAGCRRWEYV